MLKQIEIIEENNLVTTLDLILKIEEKKLYLNTDIFDIDNNFIDNITRIIRTWKNTGKSTIIDDKHITLIIDNIERIEIYKDIPTNYNILLELLRGLY